MFLQMQHRRSLFPCSSKLAEEAGVENRAETPIVCPAKDQLLITVIWMRHRLSFTSRLRVWKCEIACYLTGYRCPTSACEISVGTIRCDSAAALLQLAGTGSLAFSFTPTGHFYLMCYSIRLWVRALDKNLSLRPKFKYPSISRSPTLENASLLIQFLIGFGI